MNFQTIPRDELLIKRALVPKLDALMFFDYVSIEPRILAYYMSRIGDDEMAQEFREGRDPYQETADRVGISRQQAKQLQLSMMYGGGVPTVIRQLGVGRDEAKSLLSAFNKARPGVATLRNALVTVQERRGYLFNLFGRQFSINEDHKLINTLIQGCAADLMKWALLQVSEKLKGAESQIVSTIHDEIILDVSALVSPGLSELVPMWMIYDEIDELVPIEVEVGISETNWADKRPYLSSV